MFTDVSGRFLSGIVEGFYGREWPHEARLAYAGYLARGGLNTYLYCPKGDPWLRRRWREDWPAERWSQLRELARTCAARGIAWGVGLSPFELYRDYGAGQRRALGEKIRRLAELEAPLLAVLFDDMPGDFEPLAERQGAIVADVCDWLPDTRVLACPTYYSFDPALERHFGPMPRDYWRRLGDALPPAVDIFWTGNRVCCESIVLADVEAARERFGRPVVLWDNYPVNDGAQRSRHLYLRPLPGRDPALGGALRGHLCNPMNQPRLSLPGLAGLARRYGDGLSEAALREYLGEGTWERLCRDATAFETDGLDGLGDRRRRALATEYERLSGAAAREVSGWLRGEFRFDPACLTG